MSHFSGPASSNTSSASHFRFPTYNTPAQLSELTAVKLIPLKVDDQEQRKLILSAIRKAGYVKPSEPKIRPTSVSKDRHEEAERLDHENDIEAGPSKPISGQVCMRYSVLFDQRLKISWAQEPSPVRKRKRSADEDGEGTLTREQAEGLDFKEELNEQVKPLSNSLPLRLVHDILICCPSFRTFETSPHISTEPLS